MFRKLSGREKVDGSILSKLKELTQFSQADLKIIIQDLHKTDPAQYIIDKGYGHTFEEARNEYDTRQLMWKHGVDRQDAKGALEKSNGDINKADQACKELPDAARKSLQIPSVIPTRDTHSAPNGTKNARLIVLDGMGKSQQWITGMDLAYLLDKYGREGEMTMEDIEGKGTVLKPVQTKCAAGFIHGDPFEERKVVLDDYLLPRIRDRVTIGPKGSTLRDFFLNQLEETVKDAAQCGDKSSANDISHGDYDTDGGSSLVFLRLITRRISKMLSFALNTSSPFLLNTLL
ncbi:hypothetical protein AFGD_005847 [Aspergillus flavus]|nr:hypothetical protein AFGD_005847 [Aspergillus flavus]